MGSEELLSMEAISDFVNDEDFKSMELEQVVNKQDGIIKSLTTYITLQQLNYVFHHHLVVLLTWMILMMMSWVECYLMAALMKQWKMIQCEYYFLLFYFI